MAVALAAYRYYLNEQNRALRRERVFRDRQNPIDCLPDDDIYRKYRFQRQHILLLTDQLKDLLESGSRKGGALPASLQVCLTLRFLATGTFQDVIAETVGCQQTTVSRTVRKVITALMTLAPQYIRKPTQEELRQQKEKFREMAGFPGVFGAIDCTHVRIEAPRENEHEFVNRKNYHSINVQVVCDADLLVMDCVVKNPGSVHDARILRESPLFSSMEASPLGIVLGDSAYPLRNWLMTPFLNPQGHQQENYNLRHAQTRQVIERCFGVCKRRFRCLHDELRVQPPGYTCQVIMACFMLHNLAVRLRLPIPGDQSDNPQNLEDDDTPQPTPVTAHERAKTVAGKNKRDQLVRNYF